MNNFVSPGKIVQFTAPSGGVSSGTAYLIGSLLVVATTTVAEGLPFNGAAVGIFVLPKATGAWTEGEALYWDNTAFNVTTTSSGNTLIGAAAAAAGSGDATGSVRLPGISEAGVTEGGVQTATLGTDTPSSTDSVIFVSTTGTKTGALAAGSYAGQKIAIVQAVAASTPVGTITGAFKDQVGTAKTTLALGTAVGFIFRGVWDGAAWRQVDALGGTASGLS